MWDIQWRAVFTVPFCPQMFGDAYFVAPLYGFLELYARAGGVIYGYGFTERGPDIFGNVVTLEGGSLCRLRGRLRRLC